MDWHYFNTSSGNFDINIHTDLRFVHIMELGQAFVVDVLILLIIIILLGRKIVRILRGAAAFLSKGVEVKIRLAFDYKRASLLFFG